MTNWASREEVEEQAAEWSDVIIACRLHGHWWRPLTADHHSRSGVWFIRQRCGRREGGRRCECERHQEWDPAGYASPWRAGYPPDYLSRHGRINQDGKAVLRLTSLRSMNVTEVDDE